MPAACSASQSASHTDSRSTARRNASVNRAVSWAGDARDFAEQVAAIERGDAQPLRDGEDDLRGAARARGGWCSAAASRSRGAWRDSSGRNTGTCTRTRAGIRACRRRSGRSSRRKRSEADADDPTPTPTAPTPAYVGASRRRPHSHTCVRCARVSWRSVCHSSENMFNTHAHTRHRARSVERRPCYGKYCCTNEIISGRSMRKTPPVRAQLPLIPKTSLQRRRCSCQASPGRRRHRNTCPRCARCWRAAVMTHR